MNRPADHDGEHQPGKPCAAAEIGDRVGRRGKMRHQLRRIEHVATPQIGQRVLADQVDRRLPLFEEGGIGFQPGQRFT